MDAAEYDGFTSSLIAWAAHDERVLGLVALGSMAGGERPPDQWSDHDFWVIVRDGEAAPVRAERTWLPSAERVVVHFAETEHGRSAIYDDGHLVEYAVFDNHELEIARANAYWVLVDRCDLAERMAAMAERTAVSAHGNDPSGEARVGKFLSQMVIGANRFGRGEVLSANSLIRGYATSSLISLLAAFAVAEVSENIRKLDNLDAHRRFESVYPTLATHLSAVMERPLPGVMADLLAIAREQLLGRVEALTPSALDAVAGVVARASR